MVDKGVGKTKRDEEMAHYVGDGCESCPLKSKCTKSNRRHLYIDVREKLDSDKGRAVYAKRQGLVEPLHGDDQKNNGWIQHHLRWFEKAASEFVLIRIAT